MQELTQELAQGRCHTRPLFTRIDRLGNLNGTEVIHCRIAADNHQFEVADELSYDEITGPEIPWFVESIGHVALMPNECLVR